MRMEGQVVESAGFDVLLTRMELTSRVHGKRKLTDEERKFVGYRAHLERQRQWSVWSTRVMTKCPT